MPNNRCGISNYQIVDSLATLVLFPTPFTSVECVSADEMNAQFRRTNIAGLGQIPATTGTCNYAELDARLVADDASVP